MKFLLSMLLACLAVNSVNGQKITSMNYPATVSADSDIDVKLVFDGSYRGLVAKVVIASMDANGKRIKINLGNSKVALLKSSSSLTIPVKIGGVASSARSAYIKVLIYADSSSEECVELVYSSLLEIEGVDASIAKSVFYKGQVRKARAIESSNLRPQKKSISDSVKVKTPDVAVEHVGGEKEALSDLGISFD